jgi:hypothetical protein
MKKTFSLIILLCTFSCGFFNNNLRDISINSNPSNAQIIIDGQSHGYTPAVLNLPVKEYNITLIKPNYGSTNFTTPIWWGTYPTNIYGSTTRNGIRCMLDSIVMITFFTGHCADFKQKVHNITINNNQTTNPQNITTLKRYY